jgi:hypothetical protein
MGLFDKLAFWKKDDDFSGGDFGSEMGGPQPGQNEDPLAELSKDPLADLGRDPLADSDPFSGRQQQNPMQQRQGQPVNDIGMGSNQGARSNYESVTQMPTSDPYGSRSEQSLPGASAMNKDIEIISAKIDTIRVSVENLAHKVDDLNSRLAEIEKIAKQEQDQEVRW